MAQNWFKHDYGARNDEKILELRAEYGWKGYGLFFGIIETMCEQETGAIDTDRIGGLCVAYGLPKDELLGFIEYCVEIDLLFEDDDGLIKNKRVIEHLDHMNTLKEAGKKGANKRWKGNKNRGANGGANGTPNADKTREDKTREDKNNILVAGKAFDANTKIVDVMDQVDLSDTPTSNEEKQALLALHVWNDVHNLRPNNQTTLKAKLGSWYDPVRLMIEQDERTLEDIWRLWKKVQRDGFWQKNILSTAKLREKFDQVAINLNKSNGRDIHAEIDSLYE